MTLNGVMAVTLRYFNEFGNLRSNSELLARALNILIKVGFYNSKNGEVTVRN